MHRIAIEPSAARGGVRRYVVAVVDSLGAVLLSALLTGFVGGIALRAAMRAVALVYPELLRGFTWGGTAFVVASGVLFGLANGLPYALARPALPSNPLRSGALYGAGALAVFGVPFFLSNPDGDLFGPQAPLSVALFGAIFVLGGLLMACAASGALRYLERRPRGRAWARGIGILLLVPAGATLTGVGYEMIFETIPAIRLNWG